MRTAATILLALPAILAQTTHDIAVGDGGLVFKPDTLTASVGDIVRFTFSPQNHSVAQATFDAPCRPKDSGIFSGYVPVKSGTSSETFSVPINNTDAIWIYCSQGDHCQDGMVMVINPVNNSDTSLANFKSAAAKATENSGPASGAVSGGTFAQAAGASGNSSGSATASATASGSHSSESSTASSTASSGSSGSGTASGSGTSPTASGSGNAAPGLKAEKAIGAVIGVVAGGIALGAFLI